MIYIALDFVCMQYFIFVIKAILLISTNLVYFKFINLFIFYILILCFGGFLLD